jgi:4-hydroxy-4-methyl-2-oxoglutarate aldolase
MTAYRSSPHQGRILRSFKRPDSRVVEIFQTFYSGLVLDHLGKFGAMPYDLQPLAPGMKVCGPATTTLGPDLSLRRAAIDLAQPGDVLVVAAGGIREYACFGDGTGKRMQVKGMAGAVIDGAVRDAAGLRALNFPTFCRGVTPRNYFYPIEQHYGAVNVPVTVGGQVVEPGDLMFGDDDGVVVIPQDQAAELAPVIAKQLAIEREERAAWGEYPAYDVWAELEQRGYRLEGPDPTAVQHDSEPATI